MWDVGFRGLESHGILGLGAKGLGNNLGRSGPRVGVCGFRGQLGFRV